MINQKGNVLINILGLGLLLILVAGVSYYFGTKSETPTDSSRPPASSVPTPVNPLPKQSVTPSANPTVTSSNTSDPNSPSFIRIISPNGGESFKVGDLMHITWSSNNLYKNGSCIITLLYSSETTGRSSYSTRSSTWVPVNTPQGFYDWKIGEDSGSRQTKVNMDCYDSNQNNVQDQSDNEFKVEK